MNMGLLRRWLPPTSLGTRIAVPAGLFTLASVALLAFTLIREYRREVQREVVLGSENIAEAILLSLDRDMRLNERAGVEEIIAAFSRHEDIEYIRIFNKDGEITFSSRPSEVGAKVDTAAPACVHCHAGGQHAGKNLNAENRARIFEDSAGQSVLGAIHVIPNAEGCTGSACHATAAEQTVLGILDVGMSLTSEQARLAAATRKAVLISVGAAMLIVLVLFLVIRYSVRKPLQRMAVLTRKIAEGGAGRFALEGGAREIAHLSTSFNQMIESLGSSKQQLEEWARTLEQQVQSEAEQLRQAQYQIIQAEKLSSVGLVAAGIAHELNSPLMAIVTFSHLVRSSVPPDSQALDDLRMIEREANRCAVIIRQLLDYSRKQTQEPETRPCSVEKVIRSALQLLKVEQKNVGVSVQVTSAPELPEVEANDGQLMQVFMNLLLNALQAMPDGGALQITADEVERVVYHHLELPPHSSPSWCASWCGTRAPASSGRTWAAYSIPSLQPSRSAKGRVWVSPCHWDWWSSITAPSS